MRHLDTHHYSPGSFHQVQIIDNMTSMDEDTFAALGRSWSFTLSNGSQVALRVDQEGNTKPLDYADRLEYTQEVRRIRMNECEEQVSCCWCLCL